MQVLRPAMGERLTPSCESCKRSMLGRSLGSFLSERRSRATSEATCNRVESMRGLNCFSMRGGELELTIRQHTANSECEKRIRYPASRGGVLEM
eukprot:10931754-Alexandrium_andersonii.AAC.1